MIVVIFFKIIFIVSRQIRDWIRKASNQDPLPHIKFTDPEKTSTGTYVPSLCISLFQIARTRVFSVRESQELAKLKTPRKLFREDQVKYHSRF